MCVCAVHVHSAAKTLTVNAFSIAVLGIVYKNLICEVSRRALYLPADVQLMYS